MNAQIGFRASKTGAGSVLRHDGRQERAGAFGQQIVGAASFANCPVASSIATT